MHSGVAKMFDFRRITLFCLEKRLSKYKMTIFFKILWGSWRLLPPLGHAYACAGFFSHSIKIPGLLEYGCGDM